MTIGPAELLLFLAAHRRVGTPELVLRVILLSPFVAVGMAFFVGTIFGVFVSS